MRGNGGKLERRQEQAIAALLSCATVAEAAKSCRVSEATLWRWQGEPCFSEAYAAARRQTMEQALSALQKASSTATATLLAIMQDTDAPASARVTACRSVLEYAFKGVEHLETQQRLADIEAALNLEGKST